MKRVLIGSPVRQDAPILKEFLTSLGELHTDGLDVDFMFIDNNDSEESRTLLRTFRPKGTVFLADGGPSGGPAYQKTAVTHVWREDLIWRVAGYKDQIIRFCRERQYDGLFFVDSDLVLHPETLRQLVKADVDVISEVFWTRWSPGVPDLPQVWVRDQYTLHRQRREERLDQPTLAARQNEFLAEVRATGIHEVGGLGACTLLSRRALDLGLNFREIPNLSFWGEDRHFCVRAQVLGLRLYADTHYPALHLYRSEDLARVGGFKSQYQSRQHEVEAGGAFRDAMAAWGATHYETVTGTEGLQYFAAGYRQYLEGMAAEGAATAQAEQAVTRTHVVKAEAKATGPAGARIEGDIVQEGRSGGRPLAEAYHVGAVMVREQGQWLVAQMQLQPTAGELPSVPFVRRSRGNRVTLSMIVHNEAGRFLPQVLKHAARYVDEAVILDDGSTDDTVAVCEEALAGIPHRIYRQSGSRFDNEWELRRKQWELTLATNPDWLLILDADEMFEDRMGTEIRNLINQTEFDVVSFRLYDLWDEHHYRDDQHWSAHRTYRPFLVRNVPGAGVQWRETPQHCGRLPLWAEGLPALLSDVRLKHYGWAKEEDRRQKYERYMKLDPEGRFGILAQYQSILDPHPKLAPFEE